MNVNNGEVMGVLKSLPLTNNDDLNIYITFNSTKDKSIICYTQAHV